MADEDDLRRQHMYRMWSSEFTLRQSVQDPHVQELLGQADELDNRKPLKTSLLEEAVRRADTCESEPARYYCRSQLIEAAIFGGYPEKALVAFAWCRPKIDEDPKRYDSAGLLWKYKWILDHVVSFPQVSLQQIAEMADDMEKLVTRESGSLRPVHYMRMRIARDVGRLDEAWDHFTRWQSSPRDWLADCRACEADSHFAMYLQSRRNQDAWAKAEEIIDGGLSCASVPHVTYAAATILAVRMGDLDRAASYHERGYALIRRDVSFFQRIAEHLLYLARIGNFPKAVGIWERNLHFASQSRDMHARFCYWNATALLLRALARFNRNRARKFNVPSNLACHDESGSYRPAELAEWFHGQTAEIAARFNTRNGNRYYDELMRASAELVFPDESAASESTS